MNVLHDTLTCHINTHIDKLFSGETSAEESGSVGILVDIESDHPKKPPLIEEEEEDNKENSVFYDDNHWDLLEKEAHNLASKIPELSLKNDDSHNSFTDWDKLKNEAEFLSSNLNLSPNFGENDKRTPLKKLLNFDKFSPAADNSFILDDCKGKDKNSNRNPDNILINSSPESPIRPFKLKTAIDDLDKCKVSKQKIEKPMLKRSVTGKPNLSTAKRSTPTLKEPVRKPVVKPANLRANSAPKPRLVTPATRKPTSTVTATSLQHGKVSTPRRSLPKPNLNQPSRLQIKPGLSKPMLVTPQKSRPPLTSSSTSSFMSTPTSSSTKRRSLIATPMRTAKPSLSTPLKTNNRIPMMKEVVSSNLKPKASLSTRTSGTRVNKPMLATRNYGANESSDTSTVLSSTPAASKLLRPKRVSGLPSPIIKH